MLRIARAADEQPLFPIYTHELSLILAHSGLITRLVGLPKRKSWSTGCSCHIPPCRLNCQYGGLGLPRAAQFFADGYFTVKVTAEDELAVKFCDPAKLAVME